MALDKHMHLEFSSAISNLMESNSSFDRGNLRIAYTGKNRNGSFISKASFESAIPSMFGCPVVANYMREADEIGSHDGEFVEKGDGQIKYVNITQPVGFVPPGANYWWETVDDDGVIHQYLNTEVILWKRQEAYDKIKENGITKHSMEISVEDGEMQDDYYLINKFEFTAFCLLGTAEPCFESSALFTFSKSEMQEQFDEMLKEFKLAFSSDLTEKEVNPNMNKLQELLDRYNLRIEDLEFEVENLSDEELEAKFAEVYDNANAEPAAEPAPESDDFSQEPDAEPDKDDFSAEPEDEPTPDPENDFALANQVRDALWAALRAETVVDEEYGWEFSRYYMIDYDTEVSEVYFEDMTDNYNLYGASYSFNGDNVVIDFENSKRKKYAIVDFNEGDQTFTHKEMFDSILSAGKVKCNELQSRLSEFENLRHKEEADQLLSKFEEKLGDMAEFKALKTSYADYTIQELEDKLYALVGRKQFKYAKSNKAPKAPAIPASERQDNANEPYGSLFNFLKK